MSGLLLLENRRERVRFWTAPEGGGTELLDADFFTHSYGRHDHDRYAIGVITRGGEQFAYRGGVHVAGKGDIVIVHPGEIHDGEAAVDEGWSYKMLYLPPDVLTPEGASPTAPLPFFPSPVIRDPELARRLIGLHDALGDAPEGLGRQSLMKLAADDLVRRHSSGPATPAPRRREPRAVARAREALEAAFPNPVQLDDLAAAAGVAPLYLIRAFRQATGLPPHAWQGQRRLRHAQGLLRQGLPIADVAIDCGFADQSHFTRAFKRLTGVTPGRYRSGSYKTGRPDRL